MTIRTRISRTGMAEFMPGLAGSGRPAPGGPDVGTGVGTACGNRTARPRQGTAPAGPGLDDAALWTLASWLSPGYPVGAFAYSHGLEAAVAAGDVRDAGSAGAWIADCVEHGAGRGDAILLAHAWRAEAAGDGAALDAVAELASALAPSAERLLETEAQGAAFAEVTGAVRGAAVSAAPYPVAVGRAAARHGVPLGPAALLFLHAFVANLVSAGVRLVPLGQTDGQRIVAALRPLCERVTDGALTATLEDIGGCAFRADIAAMRHEAQPVRLFRT